MGAIARAFARKDEEAIESLYMNNGFQSVKVTSEVEYRISGGKEKDLGVTYHIHEGPQWTGGVHSRSSGAEPTGYQQAPS